MGKKKRRSNIVKGRNPRLVAREKDKNKEKDVNIVSTASGQGVRGLNNLGNTCFFNSALQGLNAAVDEFPVDENTHPGHMHRTLLKALSSMRETSHTAYNPTLLHQAICDKFKQFKGRRQQDAHELLLALVSRIQDEQQSTKRDDDTLYDCVTDLFNGTLASIIQCSACNKKSVTKCSIVDISVSLPGSEKLLVLPRSVYATRTTRSTRKEKVAERENIYEKLEVAASSSESSESKSGPGEAENTNESDNEENTNDESKEMTDPPPLEELPTAPECALVEPPPFDCDTDSPHMLLEYCLSEYVKYEVLQVCQGNGYMCPHCSNDEIKRDASKRLLLLDPPKILLLHMKRLLPGGKYSVFVQFPLELDMSPFAAKHPDRPYTYTYHLYAVVVHQGTASGGHYIAYVKRSSQWYYVSDSQVRKCSEDETLRASAYMLFYRHSSYESSTLDIDEVATMLNHVAIDDGNSSGESEHESDHQ